MLAIYSALVLFATVYAQCPSNPQNCSEVDPESCFQDGQAYDLGVCCPSCIPIEDIMQGRVCLPEICDKITCIPQTLDECKPGQVFTPKGPCSCCDACRDKPVPLKCRRNQCLWNCEDVKYQTCLSKGEVYVPADNDCNCCASCQNVTDVTKRRDCPRGNCSGVECTNQTPEECRRNQVLVPGDGRNFCCDTCTFIKEIDDCT